MPLYNERGEKISKSKNGLDVVYFKDRKTDYFTSAFNKIANVFNIIKKECAVEILPIYGTLLSYIRDGKFLPQDYDFDFCYISKKKTTKEICTEAIRIVTVLRESSIRVFISSFGFIQVDLNDVTINIYVGWINTNKLFLYFGIPEGIPVPYVGAKRKLVIHERKFTLPFDPRKILNAIYGDQWAIPNAHFTYAKRILFHKNFNFLVSGWPEQTGSEFWDGFYGKKNIPDYPSQFAIAVLSEIQKNSYILDIGCGNGRDSLFFSRYGHHIVGIDASEVGINSAIEKANNQGLSANFIYVNLYKPNNYKNFIKHHKHCFDVIYARFFIHAINALGENAFWEIAKYCLKESGNIYIEARTVKDTLLSTGTKISETERISDHYRRFIKPATLISNAKKNGFKLQYKVLGQGMAKYCEEDPVVIRCTFHK